MSSSSRLVVWLSKLNENLCDTLWHRQFYGNDVTLLTKHKPLSNIYKCAHPHPCPALPFSSQDLLQFPWGLRPKQAWAGPLDLLPPGAADSRWIFGDCQCGGPRHGRHGTLRQSVEPCAGNEEARGQESVQGALFGPDLMNMVVRQWHCCLWVLWLAP